MNWKRNIQVRDLEPSHKLEISCKSCGHVHYLTRTQICVSPEIGFQYLDEVEKEIICKARGCKGNVRLAITHTGKTSGFVGGMA